MSQSAFPLGRRIQKWRERAGLSAADVALRSGVSSTALAAVEEGREPLSAYRFHRVAMALGVDPAALLGDAPNADPLRSTARFRVGASTSKLAGPDVRLLALAAEVGRVGAALMTLLGEEVTRLPAYQTPMGSPPWKQGYDLGEAARQRLCPTPGPLGSVQGTLERLGVHVAFVPFSTPDVEAASLREPGGLPVMLLNSLSERVSRPHTRRSVIAHELCHLLHDGSNQHVVTALTRGNDLNVDAEQRANGFAPAFLAPRGQLDPTAEPDALARQLVEHWGFSVEGAAWHVRNVLGMTESDAVALAKGLRAARVGEVAIAESVPRENGGVTALVHGLVSASVQRALKAGHISQGRAREIAAMG